jgi:hypothetical protein
VVEKGTAGGTGRREALPSGGWQLRGDLASLLVSLCPGALQHHLILHLLLHVRKSSTPARVETGCGKVSCKTMTVVLLVPASSKRLKPRPQSAHGSAVKSLYCALLRGLRRTQPTNACSYDDCTWRTSSDFIRFLVTTLPRKAY